MPVANVTNGALITEAWGDSVADSVTALEAANTALNVGATAPSTQAFGDAAAAGSNTHAARVDHKHAMPANPVAGLVHTINFVIDGGGVVIATGIKGDVVIDFAATITKWSLLADQSGSIVVDIWRDSYANFPPVVGDVITASAKPTISGATKGQSSTLTGWTTGIAAGDVLRFNVNSATTITRATLALTITRT